ncbi:peptidase [Streptomyces sp. NPDC051211]|uniref:peptidase n=1 Tax=Streptomyces sp. NPDC051211 TaxID=3154643 RepID=UPI00344E3DA0
MKKRLSLLAAAGLVAVGLTTPAVAADSVHTLVGPSALALQPHPATGAAEATSLTVGAEWPATSWNKDVTFTVDLGKVRGIADVVADPAAAHRQQCTVAAATLTCVARSWLSVDLKVSAAKGSTVGRAGDIAVTAKAEGAAFTPFTTRVQVGGPDLVLGKLGLRNSLAVGEGQRVPIVFANDGTTAAKGVALSMRTTRGMEFVEKYDNCAYSSDGDGPTDKGLGTTVCILEGSFEPDLAYETVEPLTLKATHRALQESLEVSVFEADKAPASKALAKPHTGRKLSLKPRAATLRSADLNPWDNTQSAGFTVRNTADFIALGDSATAKAGETVGVDLGFRNNGPAWVGYVHSGEPVGLVDITIPAGAKAAKKPEHCRGVNADGGYREQQLGAPRYFCEIGSRVFDGEQALHGFQLKIEKVVQDAIGTVRVGAWTSSGSTPHAWDSDTVNNTALLVLNPKSVTPSPSTTSGPAPSPSAGSGTGTPTPTASASGTPTATPSGNAAVPNGDLADTGSSALPLAVGSAAVLAGGAVLFVVFRRRTGRA